MGANAINMLVLQLTQITTAGVAALLIKGVGEKACFWIDSGSFVFSAAMVSTITIGHSIPTVKKALWAPSSPT